MLSLRFMNSLLMRTDTSIAKRAWLEATVSGACATGLVWLLLALPATVDGQTTAHYLSDRLAGTGVSITSLARGVPVGGELDWLDDGTIAQALRARRPA